MTRKKNFRTVTNTTRWAAENPNLNMIDCMSDPGAAIERQEARGQCELTNADVLPSRGGENPAWKKMGVIFGAKVPGDDLFRQVTLPAGWKKVPTDHHLYSNLVDDKGRPRAKIMYKAASYDRDASIYPLRRFEAAYEPEGGWNNRIGQREGCRSFAVVKDCDKEVWRSSAPIAANGPYPKTAADWEVWKGDSDMARNAAGLHIVEMGYPEWDDVTMYWDEK